MRVLLDESLPKPLARELTGHDVRTVAEQGWGGLQNGELLRRAVDHGFDAFVTADQNLEYQQQLAGFQIGVIVVAAKTNRMPDLKPLVPAILRELSRIGPGQLAHVRA